MKYTGKLYGKIGRKYIPLIMTSDDVDRLETQRNELLEALENFVTVCDSAPPIELVRYIAESCEKARAVIKKAKGETP